MVTDFPRYPVYNPDKDGNKFEWILRQANVMRGQQQAEAQRPRPKVNYLSGQVVASPKL